MYNVLSFDILHMRELCHKPIACLFKCQTECVPVSGHVEHVELLEVTHFRREVHDSVVTQRQDTEALTSTNLKTIVKKVLLLSVYGINLKTTSFYCCFRAVPHMVLLVFINFLTNSTRNTQQKPTLAVAQCTKAGQ